MDYFLLDAKSGELYTARPIDREALPDATGIIVLSVRVRISIKNQLLFCWFPTEKQNRIKLRKKREKKQLNSIF